MTKKVKKGNTEIAENAEKTGSFLLPALKGVDAIESVVEECNLAQMGAKGRIERALILATGMKQLRELITNDMMNLFLEISGSALGFKTDKDDKGGYPPDILKDAIIEALLRGVSVVGNQFNVIAKRCYITKEGFIAKMEQLPGFSNFRWAPEIPKKFETIAVAKVKASWTMNGETQTIGVEPDDICEIPCKIDGYTSIDAMLGKIERKLRARVYQRVTGQENPDGDIDTAEVKPVSVTVVDSEEGTGPMESPKEIAPPESKTSALKRELKGGKKKMTLEDVKKKWGGKDKPKPAAEVKPEAVTGEAVQKTLVPEESSGSPEPVPEKPPAESFTLVLESAWRGQSAPLSTLLLGAGFHFVEGGTWKTDALEHDAAVKRVDWIMGLKHPERPGALALEENCLHLDVINEKGEVVLSKGVIKNTL